MPASTLTIILHDLSEKAIRNAPSPLSHDLGRGLRLHVRVRDGKFSLGISRPAPQQPSEKEWQTVLSKFPQPLPQHDPPRLAAKNGRWYLVASWAVKELAEEQQP